MKKILFLAVLALYLAFGNAAAVLAEESEKQMDNTDKVVKFLQDSRVFYIATVDGKQARVRPFGAVLNIDDKVSICTGAYKNVYKQIKKNPKVEISAISPDEKWIRLSGTLINATNEENMKKFFDAYPSVASIYADEKSKDFVVLSFKNATAVIEGFSGDKEIIELK